MQICFNGQFLPAQQPVIPAQSPLFKWGEGLFETMRFRKGRLLLFTDHCERLFNGLRLLHIDPVDPSLLEQTITKLCARNGCSDGARVRLSIFRNEDLSTGWLAEAVPLHDGQWIEEGLTVGIYPHAKKSLDDLSGLKTSNYLPYIQASRYAQAQGWDDALVLNAAGRLCDSSRANLFLVRDRTIFTPADAEGCVLGVVRKNLIIYLKQNGFSIEQRSLGEKDLLEADEAFLTNAIQGLRAIARFGDRQYSNSFCGELWRGFIPTIWPG